MRLRANFRGIADRLSNEQEVKLLHSLINNSNRYYLEENLRTFNIPGRTKIYKAFGWSYNYEQPSLNSSEERNDRQLGYVRDILQHSNIVDWVETYCRDYTLGNFLNNVSHTNINLNGMDIRIEAHRNE